MKNFVVGFWNYLVNWGKNIVMIIGQTILFISVVIALDFMDIVNAACGKYESVDWIAIIRDRMDKTGRQ